MNNKTLGTKFEREICKILSKKGFWVHFISPDNRGAQPFDIIAVKDGHAIVGDCKTSASNVFPLSRLEDNQILAFEKWMACGNGSPYLFILHDEDVYCVLYTDIKGQKSIKLSDFQGKRF